MAEFPKTADPEYKFQPDNAFAKRENLFEEGLRLLKLGELKQVGGSRVSLRLHPLACALRVQC
jgi:hypothetical protein